MHIFIIMGELKYHISQINKEPVAVVTEKERL